MHRALRRSHDTDLSPKFIAAVQVATYISLETGRTFKNQRIRGRVRGARRPIDTSSGVLVNGRQEKHFDRGTTVAVDTRVSREIYIDSGEFAHLTLRRNLIYRIFSNIIRIFLF